GQKKVSSPQKNSPLDDNLTEAKTKVVAFLEQRLTTNNIKEIEKWVQDKNYDPLKGVNLAGVDLKGKSDNGKVSDLEGLTIAEQKHLATKYKDYVQLSAAGDGN
ncbi:31327_t:CDS:2, partial [Racocetra persica]